MPNQEENKNKDDVKKKTPVKEDPATTENTDPQEEMEGPVSSIMQNIKEEGAKNDAESKEEANRKKDKNL